MNFLNKHCTAVINNSGLATGNHFCKLFIRDMESLYLLAFLLTGNHDKAEQCFLESLDECLSGISVFQEWADFAARRVIVRQALRMTAQHAGPLRSARDAVDSTGQGDPPETSVQDVELARVLALEDFERLVFVLSVLEGYSGQCCSLFTGASRQNIGEAGVRALQHIADFDMERSFPAGSSVTHA